MQVTPIIQAAAWIYVIKQLLPLVLPLVLLPASYVAMRLYYGDKEKADREWADAVLQGVKEALDA